MCAPRKADSLAPSFPPPPGESHTFYLLVSRTTTSTLWFVDLKIKYLAVESRHHQHNDRKNIVCSTSQLRLGGTNHQRTYIHQNNNGRERKKNRKCINPIIIKSDDDPKWLSRFQWPNKHYYYLLYN